MTVLVLALVAAAFIVVLPAGTALVIWVVARPDIELAREAKRFQIKQLELQTRALEEEWLNRALEPHLERQR
jgi:hypothetical protein